MLHVSHKSIDAAVIGHTFLVSESHLDSNFIFVLPACVTWWYCPHPVMSSPSLFLLTEYRVHFLALAIYDCFELTLWKHTFVQYSKNNMHSAVKYLDFELWFTWSTPFYHMINLSGNL